MKWGRGKNESVDFFKNFIIKGEEFRPGGSGFFFFLNLTPTAPGSS